MNIVNSVSTYDICLSLPLQQFEDFELEHVFSNEFIKKFVAIHDFYAIILITFVASLVRIGILALEAETVTARNASD
jgi:hypothetical protein